MSASGITFYKCATCKLYIPQQKTCQLMIAPMQGQIEPTDYCTKYVDKIEYCELCGNGILAPLIEASANGEVHTYCASCLKLKEQKIQKNDEEKNDKNDEEKNEKSDEN